MAKPADDVRSKLKGLRDKLAFETPRAQSRPNVPAELIERLRAALEVVGQMYLLGAAPSSASLEEAYEDALVEGHLALSEWERWLAQEKRPRARSSWSTGAERRQHDRQPTQVMVKLLRHSVRGQGPAYTLTTETASRPARNVSVGGIYVNIGRGELADIAVGSVVHVSVSAVGEPQSYSVRGEVIRRDDSGIALRGVAKTPAEQRMIESVVAAARRGESR
jgi:hypothetical protein